MRKNIQDGPMDWTSRSFLFNHPPGAFPAVLDRFRGAVPRMEEAVRNTPVDLLRHRPEGKWCILQHAGHLLVLESLGEIRLNDYLQGSAVLTPADMGNRETEKGGFDGEEPDVILQRFRGARTGLADRLSVLSPGDIVREALHQRLNRRLRLIDWVCFMCEHDDHHLAVIGSIRARGLPAGGRIR